MILKDRWSTQKEPGQIRNITYRNISAPEGSRCLFRGFDAEHGVSNVCIDGYYENGRRLSEQEMRIERNEFTRNFTVLE